MRRVWAWLFRRLWGNGEAAGIAAVREQADAAYRRAVADTARVRRAAAANAALPPEDLADRLRDALILRRG